MNKDIPLSIEWMAQNTYVHSSLEHLEQMDKNQHNFVLIKQEREFLENALNSQSMQNIMCLQVSSKEKDKEIKQQTDSLEMPITVCQTNSLNQSSKILAITSEKLHNRGHIEVVEMSVVSLLNYKYLFIYEDRLSNFVVLKALHTNTAKEVAIKLLDILAMIGAPRVLQSGNGRKFAEQVVHELRLLWNNLIIFHGETVSKCEINCRDFKTLIESWIKQNPTKTWCEGLNFVQVFHNSTFHCQNGKIPCNALFGRNVDENFEAFNRSRDMENFWTEEEWIEYSSNKIDKDTVTIVEDVQNVSDNVNQLKESETIQSSGNQNKAVRNSHVKDFSFVNIKNETIGDNIQTNITCTDETDICESKVNEDAEGYLKCRYCQKRYMKLGHLKNHIRTHRTARAFRCKLCSKTFSVARLYEKHIKQSHGQDKLSSKEDHSDNRNTKISIGIATSMCNEKKSKLEVLHAMADPNSSNENCDVLTNIKNSSNKNVKNLSVSSKRKLSAESRVSKMQCSLQCTYCKQKFSFPSVLERHMRSHTNERPYVCEVCNKSFKQLGHLSQHSLTHHDYRSFQCTICNLKLDSLDSLKQHAHSHKGDTPQRVRDVYRLFECDSCKKVFTTKSVLERHIFTHTQERQFDCKVCGKRFKQAGHVKSHMLVHTGERKFQCTVCSKRFSLSNSLKKHMYVHNGEKPYQCDVCGARFLEKRNLNGHLLTHTNERPYCCKICGKRYTLADTLRRHISAAHEDGRTYQCEICAKMFKQLAHLSVHKKVHNDERPFQCHLCEKNFKHKNVLKSHLAIHANVRPFECDVCKATFVRKTNLQTHISSAHMNERPYVCTICGKRFKQISHLNGHVVVHSNLMPYKCDFCDRRCNRLDNLKKHMRLHTKNKE